MRLLTKPRLRTLLAVLPLLLILSFLFSGTASASTQHPAGQCAWTWHWTGYVDGGIIAGYYTASYCAGSHTAEVPTWIYNCTGGYHSAQTDTWQTRWIDPQGTRYGETGRSGWVTYPPDCYSYYTQTSWLPWNGQLQDPSYGCVWLAADGNPYNAIDYQCSQFPTF